MACSVNSPHLYYQIPALTARRGSEPFVNHIPRPSSPEYRCSPSMFRRDNAIQSPHTSKRPSLTLHNHTAIAMLNTAPKLVSKGSRVECWLPKLWCVFSPTMEQIWTKPTIRVFPRALDVAAMSRLPTLDLDYSCRQARVRIVCEPEIRKYIHLFLSRCHCYHT